MVSSTKLSGVRPLFRWWLILPLLLLLLRHLQHGMGNLYPENVMADMDHRVMLSALSQWDNDTETRPHSKPRITLQEIVNGTEKGCNGEYRNYPVNVQDSVNALLAEALLREPSVPVRKATPPEVQTDCSSNPAAFTGSIKSKPLFSAFMFSHEMDLLEARLFEGMGLVDKTFIAESRFTHRGHRKRMFASEAFSAGGRFSRFADVVEIVDLDDNVTCPDYVQTIQRYRNGNPRPRIIWSTQSTAQSCLAEKVKSYTQQHNEYKDAVVQVSDLDEIIYRKTLASIKHCEIRPNGEWPIIVATTHSNVAKFCRPLSETSINRVLFRATEMSSQRFQDLKQAVRIDGGIHLTYFGGSLVEYFKSTNHAEGGGLNSLGWLNETYNPTVCMATREDWYRREELLCTDQRTVRRPWEPSPRRRNEQQPISVAYDEALLPWVVARNKKRYPCFFADHRACVGTYIDYFIQ